MARKLIGSAKDDLDRIAVAVHVHRIVRADMAVAAAAAEATNAFAAAEAAGIPRPLMKRMIALITASPKARALEAQARLYVARAQSVAIGGVEIDAARPRCIVARKRLRERERDPSGDRT